MGFFSKLFGGAKKAADTTVDMAGGAVDMAAEAGATAMDAAGDVAAGAADMAKEAGAAAADMAGDAVEAVKDTIDGNPNT